MSTKILSKFVEQGINLSPSAYRKIISLKDPLDFSSSLIVKLKSGNYSNNEFLSLNESIVDNFIKTLELKNSENSLEDINNNLNHLNNTKGEQKTILRKIDYPNQEFKDSYPNNSCMVQIENSNNDNNIKPGKIKRNLNSFDDAKFDFKIIKDTSGKSYTSGKISNLINYFNNRYEKLASILNKRPELKIHQKITDIDKNTKDMSIICMIKEIKTTKNNHKLVEIEDNTGEMTVLFHNENHELFKASEKLVKDEVIGLLVEKKGSLNIASKIIHPGFPRIHEKKMDFTAVFTSDIHIGSLTFLEDAFTRFIKWMNGDFGSEEHRKIANDIKYLIIAGDIVDGVGIYPNQDKELAIKDIYSQYDEAARLLGELRNDIKIIVGPGNHDASRVAEPQPSVSEKYAKSLYELDNIEFISNPGIVSLDGLNILIYHGRGFDDIAMTIKGMSHERNDIIMRELLKKRHLAPIYGERTPLASELEDHLVIDNVPDVFHTGHVHINSYKKYNGVHMINSGTFQTQTEFQKIYNIIPTCAEVPILHKGNYKQLKFI